MRAGLVAVCMWAVPSAACAAEVWSDLNKQVTVLFQQGKYSEAQGVAAHAHTTAEPQIRADKPATALSLNHPAMIYKAQGLMSDA